MSGGVVFILGAGASVSSGAPVMRDFFQKAKRLKRRYRLLNYENDFKIVENARHALRRAKIKSRLDVDNLEEVFTAFEMIQIIDGIEGLNKAEAKVACKSLRNLIAGTFQESIEFLVDKRDRTKPAIIPTPAYECIAHEAEEIRRIHSTFPITFITFNYDIAFDFALKSATKHYTYCLEMDKQPKRDMIHYCKLHGSLHWALDKKSDEILCSDLDFSALNDPDKLLEDKKVRFHIEDLWETHRNKHIEFPFIIPPTGNKEQLHSHLKPVWKQAAKALKNAEIIIVIGYSFPSTDPFFKNFFALSTIGQTDIEKVIIIDPSKEAANSLIAILSPDLIDKFIHREATFDRSTNYLSKVLSEYLNDW